MITFSITRANHHAIIADLLAAFEKSVWLNILVSRMEMTFENAGAMVTAEVALWGCEDAIRCQLEAVGIEID